MVEGYIVCLAWSGISGMAHEGRDSSLGSEGV